MPENQATEQVRVADMRELTAYTDREFIPEEYAAILNEVNTTFKPTAHFLTGSVELIDPAIISLSLNHMCGSCRLSSTHHTIETCLKVHVTNWFNRMTEVAKQQNLDLPKIAPDFIDRCIPVLMRRAEHLTRRIEDRTPEIEAMKKSQSTTTEDS